MDREKAIALLKQALAEIPKLKNLSHDNPDYQLWFEKVRLTKTGLPKLDYQKIERARVIVLMPITDAELENAYLRSLNNYEQAFKSIIQRHEIMYQEVENTATQYIQLFDAMQFHPEVIKASRGLFKDGHYAQAIFEAFKAVEIFVKEKSGCDAYGRNLMATAFNEEKPKIIVPEGGVFDKDVQEGFKLLFMGASQGIRDTKAHKDIIQKDPYITLEYLGFASFLLKRISYWEAGTI